MITQRRHTPNHGFTLLEAVIALSLGVVILLVTYSGFRVAVNSMTLTERKALENQLLIAGVMIVMEQADQWTDLDVPGDTSQQLLRTNPGKVIDHLSNSIAADGGDWQQLPQPFTPLEASWQHSGSGIAYDPDRWHPHHEASWYRGDAALYLAAGATYTDQSAYGNYALMSAAGGGIDYFADGSTTIDPVEQWQDHQQLGLSYALGYYGWLDYLPAHAMVDLYAVHSDQRTLRPSMLRQARRMEESEWGGSDYSSTHDDARFLWEVSPPWHGRIAQQVARNAIGSMSNGIMTPHRSGSERAATPGSFVLDLHTAISGPVAGESHTMHRYRASLNRAILGNYGHQLEQISSFTALLQSGNREQRIISHPPDDWPTIQVGMRRLMHSGSRQHYAFVRLVDPISGRSEELFMPIIGTTLRGARLSRGLDQ